MSVTYGKTMKDPENWEIIIPGIIPGVAGVLKEKNRLMQEF